MNLNDVAAQGPELTLCVCVRVCVCVCVCVCVPGTDLNVDDRMCFCRIPVVETSRSAPGHTSVYARS
jgi:hypothetical protein